MKRHRVEILGIVLTIVMLAVSGCDSADNSNTDSSIEPTTTPQEKEDATEGPERIESGTQNDSGYYVFNVGDVVDLKSNGTPYTLCVKKVYVANDEDGNRPTIVAEIAIQNTGKGESIYVGGDEIQFFGDDYKLDMIESFGGEVEPGRKMDISVVAYGRPMDYKKLELQIAQNVIVDLTHLFQSNYFKTYFESLFSDMSVNATFLDEGLEFINSNKDVYFGSHEVREPMKDSLTKATIDPKFMPYTFQGYDCIWVYGFDEEENRHIFIFNNADPTLEEACGYTVRCGDFDETKNDVVQENVIIDCYGVPIATTTYHPVLYPNGDETKKPATIYAGSLIVPTGYETFGMMKYGYKIEDGVALVDKNGNILAYKDGTKPPSNEENSNAKENEPTSYDANDFDMPDDWAESEYRYVRASDGYTNMRSGPGIEYPALLQLPNGSQVEYWYESATASNGKTWLKVAYDLDFGDWVEGWIAESQLE